MMSGLRPYTEMKDSGTTWIGLAPVHWQVVRIKNVASIHNGATPSTSNSAYWNGDILWLTPDDLGSLADIRIRSSSRKLTRAGYNSCGTSLAPRGSIVVSTRAPIGHLAILDQPACVNQGCKLLSLRDGINSDYFYFLLLTARTELQSLGTGTTFDEISRLRIGAVRIVVPPLAEQCSIARFIDHLGRQTQTYIRAKEKLISSLDLYKKTLIHQVVTGQINVRTGRPYGAYKDSEVGWLGMVPKHWEVLPLKRIGEMNGGTGFPIAEQGLTDKEILFAKVSDMTIPGNERYIRATRNTVSREVAHRLGARVFGRSAIVFPKVGGALLTNKRRVLTRDTCIDNNIMAFDVTSADRQYIFRVLTSLDLGLLAKPGPVPAISEGEVREIRIALPSINEQTDIARFLDQADSRIQTYVQSQKKLIALLFEYKHSLIDHVVTGKLDVREAAARLTEVDSITEGASNSLNRREIFGLDKAKIVDSSATP